MDNKCVLAGTRLQPLEHAERSVSQVRNSKLGRRRQRDSQQAALPQRRHSSHPHALQEGSRRPREEIGTDKPSPGYSHSFGGHYRNHEKRSGHQFELRDRHQSYDNSNLRRNRDSRTNLTVCCFSERQRVLDGEKEKWQRGCGR
jgi:hypothetical protein